VTTVIVPSRFNGPPASGQGGYSSGVLAAHLAGPAAVSLRRPIPLDRELEVRVEKRSAESGDQEGKDVASEVVARAFDAGGELVAEAVPAPPLAPWDASAVSLKAAHRA
jgi:hypothetical protein